MRYFLQWSLVGKLMKAYSFQVVVEYILQFGLRKEVLVSYYHISNLFGLRQRTGIMLYVCAISTFHCQGYHKMTDSECYSHQ